MLCRIVLYHSWVAYLDNFLVKDKIKSNLFFFSLFIFSKKSMLKAVISKYKSLFKRILNLSLTSKLDTWKCKANRGCLSTETYIKFYLCFSKETRSSCLVDQSWLLFTFFVCLFLYDVSRQYMSVHFINPNDLRIFSLIIKYGSLAFWTYLFSLFEKFHL